jgi:nucleoside phosphorylase
MIFPFQDELNSFLVPGEKTFTQDAGPLRVLIPAGKPHWRLAVCGQGKVEAALACQILAERLSPEAYLLIGSATALDPSLKVGSLVVADPCVEWDFGDGKGRPTFRPEKIFPTGPEVQLTPRSGTILSGDRNVFEPEEKAQLRERYQALALAWEGAGFQRCLRRNRTLGWELRLITEAAGEGRLTMAALKDRLAKGFPPVRTMIQALF